MHLELLYRQIIDSLCHSHLPLQWDNWSADVSLATCTRARARMCVCVLASACVRVYMCVCVCGGGGVTCVRVMKMIGPGLLSAYYPPSLTEMSPISL